MLGVVVSLFPVYNHDIYILVDGFMLFESSTFRGGNAPAKKV